jgi:hypothetical protein
MTTQPLTEIVYLGHDNSIDLLLKADDVAQSLASVTRATITIGEVTIDSDNGETDPIRWAKSGYDTGEIRLFLGGQTLVEAAQPYTSYLVIYDADHPEGIVWGYVLIRVKAEVERL